MISDTYFDSHEECQVILNVRLSSIRGTLCVTSCKSHARILSSISISLEVKPQLKIIILELTAKAMSVRIFPLAVHDLESNVLQDKQKREEINQMCKMNCRKRKSS